MTQMMNDLRERQYAAMTDAEKVRHLEAELANVDRAIEGKNLVGLITGRVAEIEDMRERKCATPDLATAVREGVETSAVEDAAYKVLRAWRLSTMAQEDEPSAGYPLVDAVSTPGTNIGTGEEELREIAHEIAATIRTSTPASGWGIG